MERPSWLPARETDATAAEAASALNPRAPLTSFRSTPPKREVVLEMSSVTVSVPAVPRVEPVYDPVPQPRPLKPDEDKPVKDNKADKFEGLNAGQTAMGTAAYLLQDLTAWRLSRLHRHHYQLEAFLTVRCCHTVIIVIFLNSFVVLLHQDEILILFYF
jgi:hypothetical protein